MGNTIRITESQFNRLFKTEDSLNEFISPLREILKCRITEDRKYVTYLGRVYDGVTGEELPLTEQSLGLTKALGTTGKVATSDDGWSLSDILHTGVDLVSTAADFIVPGSGAIIDIVHALSYIVEAQFSSGEEQDTLYLMAAITGMFAILPGALQAVAPILKRFVSSGGKMALKEMPKLKGVWDIISKNISKFLSELPKWVDKAVNSPIGKKLLGGNVDKISSAIKNFSTRIKGILDKLKSKTARLQSNVQKSVEGVMKKGKGIIAKRNIKNWESILEKGKVVSKKGVPFDINSKEGLKIITENPKQYIDKIVFDAKTGKAFVKNSVEGIETVANNKKFLDAATGKLRLGQTALDFVNKGIPKEFLKHLDTPLKQTSKISSKVATKKLSKIPYKESKDIIGKYILGYKKLDSNQKGMLKLIHNSTPFGSSKNFIKNVRDFVKGDKKSGITRQKSLMKAIGNLLIIDGYVEILTRVLCETGLKNRDDVERLITWYDKVRLQPETDGMRADILLKIGALVWNASNALGDAFVGIFDKPCRAGYLPAETIHRMLDEIPYIEEIPGVGTIKDILKYFGSISDEEIKNTNIKSVLNKKQSSDKEDKPEIVRIP